MKLIPVTCALIFSEGKVLSAKRAVHKRQSGFWEFPGGKIEKEETPETSLVREITEELSIQIKVVSALNTSDYGYVEGELIRLMPFLCLWKSGEIRMKDHDEVRWLDQSELFSLPWAPADIPIVHELDQFWNPIQKLLLINNHND